MKSDKSLINSPYMALGQSRFGGKYSKAKSGITYFTLLDNDSMLAAGASTFTDGQTNLPGFVGGSWTATLTPANAGGYSITAGGKLLGDDMTTRATDQCMLVEQTGIARAFGLCLRAEFDDIPGSETHQVGFSNSNTAVWQKQPLAYLKATTVTGDGVGPAAYADAGGYARKVVIAVGGFNSDGQPFKVGDTVADYLYGFRIFIYSDEDSSWRLGLLQAAGNDATLYPYLHSWFGNVTTTRLAVPQPASYSIPQSVYEARDMHRFTAADTTAITAVTADVGSTSWTVQSGAAEVESNKIKFTTAGIATIPGDSGDGDGLAWIQFTSPASGTDYIQYVYRFTDTDNYWAVRVALDGMEIVERNAGVETIRATSSFTLVASTDYYFHVIHQGDSYHQAALEPLGSTAECVYTTTNTFNQTAHTKGIGDSVANNGRINSVSFWPLERADYTSAVSL